MTNDYRCQSCGKRLPIVRVNGIVDVLCKCNKTTRIADEPQDKLTRSVTFRTLM